jgi:hypothetical protein
MKRPILERIYKGAYRCSVIKCLSYYGSSVKSSVYRQRCGRSTEGMESFGPLVRACTFHKISWFPC